MFFSSAVTLPKLCLIFQSTFFCVIVVFWAQLERGGYTLLYPEELYSQEIMAHIRLNQMECTLLFFFFFYWDGQAVHKWKTSLLRTGYMLYICPEFYLQLVSWCVAFVKSQHGSMCGTTTCWNILRAGCTMTGSSSSSMDLLDRAVSLGCFHWDR